MEDFCHPQPATASGDRPDARPRAGQTRRLARPGRSARRPKRAWLAGLGLLLVPAAGPAQNSQANQAMTAVQQRQIADSAGQAFSTNAIPELYPGETEDVGVQSPVQVKPWRPRLEGSADVQYYYTDNALYTTHNLQGSDVLVSTVQADLTAPPIELGGGWLTPRLGIQSQWYNYGLAASGSFVTYNNSAGTPETKDLGALDFVDQTVFLDGTWRWNDWLFGAGVDYRRFVDFPSYGQFYSELVPRWGVQRTFLLSPTTSLSLSYDGTYRVTDATDPSPGMDSSSGNRTDQNLMVAGNWQLCSKIILQPYYRFGYSHYTGIDRDDLWNTFGLSLNYALTRQINLRVFGSYDYFNTDGNGVQNFQALSGGVGVNLTVVF